MKTLEEIKNAPYLIISDCGEEGGSGRVMFGKLDASVIFSWGAGWDHVSVAPFKHNYTPTWEDMCKLLVMRTKRTGLNVIITFQNVRNL